MKKQIFIAHLEHEETPEDPRVGWDNLGHMICAHGRYNLGDEQSDAPCNLGGYEDSEDNFLIWIFSEFMETSSTCPKILEDWYTNGYSAVLCKDGKNLEEIWLEDTIPATFKQAIYQWIQENLCILPLFLYDHSGITMNTSGFSCGWDSGQVGYIYMTKETWVKETKQEFSQEAVKKVLEGEVETYDQYLTGEVYGRLLYRIDDEDFEISRNISLLESNPLYDLYMGDYEFSISEYDDYEELDGCWGYYGFEYSRDSCKQDFPGYCLAECLGDHCQSYIIKQVIPANNSIINTLVTRVYTVPRQKALDILQKIPEKLLHTFTVEPLASVSRAPSKTWGYM